MGKSVDQMEVAAMNFLTTFFIGWRLSNRGA
jgi:hypothetical protein